VNIFLAGLGTAIVLAILWEVFHDLFHPAGAGVLSAAIGRGVFGVMRRNKAILPAAGPLALVLVIVTWMLALVLGFALIYNTGFPERFRTSTSTIPPADHRPPDLLYFSFETLVTLGYGDLVPQAPTFRLLATTEALLGFALVTASLSSIVLIYPALQRTRTLALGVAHLAEAEKRSGLSPAAVDSDVVLAGLAREVTQARIDLIHFPIIYFFATDNEDASIMKWTGVLARYARDAQTLDRLPHVRIAAAALNAALDGLAEILTRHISENSSKEREAVFIAVAKAHRVHRHP
jgi:voltage-gated potassium channel Kch